MCAHQLAFTYRSNSPRPMLLTYTDRWTMQLITASAFVLNSVTHIEIRSDEISVANCSRVTTACN